MDSSVPSAKVFSALLAGNVRQLYACPAAELRPFLPCLSRIVLCPPTTTTLTDATTTEWESSRTVVHALIAGMQDVNTLQEYLSVNFQELKLDAQKEQQLLRKLGPGEERAASQSILASSLQFGLAIEFERSDCMRRFRLFLSEILRIVAQVENPFKLVQSDLFECEVHLEEICDILCIAAAELPSLLPAERISEALLRLERGPHLLCRLIANLPDQFDQVVTSLLLNGETLDEVSLSGRCRSTAIKLLCSMHPSRSAFVQSLAVTHCKHPTLALSLALDVEDQKTRMEPGGMEVDLGMGGESFGCLQMGVVTLLHNVIITGDEQRKTWFAQYLKCMQQKYRRHKASAVSRLRKYLMKTLRSFTKIAPFPTQLDKQHTAITGTGTGQEPGMENEATEDPMEEADTELVIDTAGVGAGDPKALDAGERTETETEAEEGMESENLTAATLELVDQMEIEISDHEGGGGDTESGGDEKSKKSKQTSATAAGSGAGKSGAKPEGKDAAKPQTRRRRHSSTLDKTDFPPISLERQLSDDEIIDLMNLLHVCCALKIQAQMYLKDEEAAVILGPIACSCPPFSPAGVRFVEVALCILLACPFLISLEECEHAVVKWFQWLLEKLPNFDRACEGHCSYGELLLLIAIHLRERQLGQIEGLVTSTLQMKVSSSLRSGHFSLLRQLFMRVFTEEVVCAHAVSVPPTPQLSARTTGYLPVHCIHQLIKTRTFRKYGISIKNWIYQQVLNVGEPLHPTLPLLLQEFVTATLLSGVSGKTASGYHSVPSNSQGANATNHVPFSAEEILVVFRHPPDGSGAAYPIPSQLHPPDGSGAAYPIPSQLLMFYYVLLYQDCYLTNLKALLTQPRGSAPKAYSPNVLVQIPMKHLLQHVRQQQGDYATLYPSLLKLTATHFPQLCLVEDWLKEEECAESATFVPIVRLSPAKVTPASAKAVLQQLRQSPSRALLLLNHLSSLSLSALIPYAPTLNSTLPLLLDPSVPRRVQALYLSLWTKLNTVIPRRLWLETVNVLRPTETQVMQPLTHQNLTEDPLIVLRCDRRVFRCPAVLEILLRVLAAYTAASKAWLQEHAHTQYCVAMATPEPTMLSSSGHVTKLEREELCIALTAAQEGAIVQLLLEICLPTEEDKEVEASFGPQLSALCEVHCLVCSYLHQTFIAEPSMVKLVHFQGYPLQLLPMMVSGVPSMHICLDFIPELLAQPEMQKQQFAVQLAAHVIQQYPLPDAMGIAKDIFKRLALLASEIPAKIREEYFHPLLPSVVKLCQTFPPLCSEATEFLVHLSKVCVPLTSGVTGKDFADTNHERKPLTNGKPKKLLKSIQSAFQELVDSAVVRL